MKRFLLSSTALLLALTTVADARTLIVGIPANLSDTAHTHVDDVIGGIYDGLQPGDDLIVIDANHLNRVTEAAIPAQGFASKKAKARALGPVFQKIYAFTSADDRSAEADNLNIPPLLHEIGDNILPAVDGRRAQILLLGSLIWSSPQDASFTFRDGIPSDGILTGSSGPFSIQGRSGALTGALVSVCYTDPPSAFQADDFKTLAQTFWGKMISGQGGKVGAMEPVSSDCAGRLFSPEASVQSYRIDPNDTAALITIHWQTVPVR